MHHTSKMTCWTLSSANKTFKFYKDKKLPCKMYEVIGGVEKLLKEIL